MSNTPSRPAREDEVEPSEDMREADRANGEPDAADRDDDTATLVTSEPERPPGAPAKPDGPHNDETGEATLVTDEPGE